MFTMNPFEYIKRTNNKIIELRQKLLEKCEKDDQNHSDIRKGKGYEQEVYHHADRLKSCTKIWTADMRYTKNDIQKPNYNTKTFYIKNNGEESMTPEELYRARKEEHDLHSSFDDKGKIKEKRISHLDGFNTTRIFRS